MRRNHALTAAADDDDSRFERNHHRRPIRRRVGVREAAADSAAIAHLRVADLPGGFRQDGTGVAEQIARFNLKVRRHRADAKLSAFFADVSEITYAPDVDQDGWRGESEFHRRDETVAARQYLGIIGVLRQQRERSEEHTSEL